MIYFIFIECKLLLLFECEICDYKHGSVIYGYVSKNYLFKNIDTLELRYIENIEYK